MAKQDLDTAQIAGRLVDQRGFILTMSHPRSLLSMAKSNNAVPEATMLVEVEPDSPNVAWPQRSFGSNLIPGVPRTASVRVGI